MHPKTSYAHEASSVLAEAAYVEELLSVHLVRVRVRVRVTNPNPNPNPK